jgi:hypothetical protein
MHLQIVLLDNHSWPDKIQQLVLAHDAIPAGEQRLQEVERTGANLRGLSIDQELALLGSYLDATGWLSAHRRPSWDRS